MNKYNTAIRNAISHEYVRCGKEKAAAEVAYEEITSKLLADNGTLSHKQYMTMCTEAERLRKLSEDLQIELNTWDKAREICLNIADDML